MLRARIAWTTAVGIVASFAWTACVGDEPATGGSDAAADSGPTPGNDGSAGDSGGPVDGSTSDAQDAAAVVVRYGNFTAFDSSVSLSSGAILGDLVTVTAPMTATKLGVIATNGNGVQVVMGLYTNASNHPVTLLASTSPTLLSTGTQEIAIPPVSLSVGDYWVVAEYTAPGPQISADTNSGTPILLVEPFDASLPTTWPTAGYASDPDFNYYVVGTE